MAEIISVPASKVIEGAKPIIGTINPTVIGAPTTRVRSPKIINANEKPVMQNQQDQEDSQLEGKLEEVSGVEPLPLPEPVEDGIQKATDTDH